MRKPQRQPKLAGLSEAELEQLADLLRHQTYDAVLDRVTKPRPEGFGLDISLSPLRTFHAKVGLLDAINSKLPADKKMSLALFETLETREIYYLTAAENQKSLAEAHQSILNTTCNLAATADSPSQLTTLQRLIDFPARAEIRAAKEDRAQEMHDHRIEMDHFRKHIATERLALTRKSFNLRESKRWHEAPAEFSRDDTNEITATQADKEPSSFPLPAGDEGQGEGFRAQSNDARPADQNATAATPATEQNVSTLNAQLSTAKTHPYYFSPEFLAKSRQHTHDLITGKIKPKFIPPEIPCPDPDPLWEWLIDDYVAPPGVNTDPNRYVNGETQPHLDSRKDRNNPNTQPSAYATSSTDVPNRSNGGTRSPSPTSTSRDEINETTAAPADQNASNFAAPNSGFLTQNSELPAKPHNPQLPTNTYPPHTLPPAKPPSSKASPPRPSIS